MIHLSLLHGRGLIGEAVAIGGWGRTRRVKLMVFFSSFNGFENIRAVIVTIFQSKIRVT